MYLPSNITQNRKDEMLRLYGDIVLRVDREVSSPTKFILIV